MLTLLLLACHRPPPPPVLGDLAPCWSTPNCVSSQAPEDDAHYVAPLPGVGLDAEGLARVVRDLPGAHEVQAVADGVLATFKTPSGLFTDDLHLWIDPEGSRIHVRSSSRLGIGDRGVNRTRVEALRAALVD